MWFSLIVFCKPPPSTTPLSQTIPSHVKLIVTMVILSFLQQQCNVNPCANSGTCWTSGDSFYCACRPGYTGKMCEGKCNCNVIVFVCNVWYGMRYNQNRTEQNTFEMSSTTYFDPKTKFVGMHSFCAM